MAKRSSLVWVTTLLLAAVVTAGCGGGGESEGFRIGIVSLTEGHDEVIEGFIAGLEDSGFAEGENVTFVYDGPVGCADDLDWAVARVLERDVDLVFALTTPVTRTVMEATSESGIPVVFSPVTDPVGSGVVESLSAPGGNLTGVTNPFYPGKQLEFLLAIQPDTRRVLVPFKPDDLSSVASLEAIEAVAELFGVDIEVVETSTAEDVSALMASLPAGVDAMMLPQTGLFVENIEVIAKGAMEHGIPLISGAPVAEKGALLSFGLNFDRIGEQAARLVVSILRGTPPGEIPVESADNYLTINLGTSERIGLVIPAEVLRQADDIFR